jgi:hypothetical protein
MEELYPFARALELFLATLDIPVQYHVRLYLARNFADFLYLSDIIIIGRFFLKILNPICLTCISIVEG